MKMTNQKLRQAALCLALSAAPAIGNMACASSRYDAVKDFSIKSNPNGVWTYMDSAPLAYAHRKYENVKGLYNWSDDLKSPFEVSIIRNKTGSPVSLENGTLTLPTGYLAMHGGANSPGAGIGIQFQAPSVGTYDVDLNVVALDTNEARKLPVIVYQNGVAVEVIIVRVHGHARYRNGFALASGDTLSFVADSDNKNKPVYVGIALKITGP
jgi:hypothetical protein